MSHSFARELSPTARQLDDELFCIDAGYIRPWFACVYLLGCGDEYALIETGTAHTLANIRALMQSRGIDPGQVRYVVPTHIHLDHAGGAGHCMRTFPDAQLLVHPRAEPHITDPGRLIDSATQVYGESRFRELYGEILAVEPGRVRVPADGQELPLGSRRLAFRYTAGHADHHFCVWEESRRAWFTGDMFGICYPWLRFPGGEMLFPSTTPTQFRPDEYAASLQLLDSYKPLRMYLTHAGGLDYSQRLLDGLLKQLWDYRDLAGQYMDNVPELALQLGDYSVAAARALAYEGDEGELRNLLAMDTDLNAQGLSIWARRAKAAGS